MMDSNFLGKEIRRRVKKWEVVEPELEEFFAMEVDPSEEDRALVFGSASSSSTAPPQQNVVVSSPIPPATPPPASLPVPSLSPLMIDTMASSSNADAAAIAPLFPPRQRLLAKSIAISERGSILRK